MTEYMRAQVKEMVGVLILSPFYFSIPVREHLEFIRELVDRY